MQIIVSALQYIRLQNVELDDLGVKYTGFHTEGGGGPWNPPPRNLEIEYAYYIGYLHVTELSMCHQNVVVPDCVRSRSNLRGCKFKIFLGGHAPRPP